MMRWIVGSSLRARRGVVAAAVVFMSFGVWQLRTAKIEALPEFAPPTVWVQTDALGLSAEEVEQLITVPIEQDLLDGVAWLDTIRSRSVPGLSAIELIFKRGTNIYRARQVVQERISQAAGLPNVSRPPQMLQPQSSTGRTSLVALSSKTLSPIQVGVLARWTIRPRLLSVPGVANVAIWGQRERQLQVRVDPKKLQDKSVSLEQIISSTGNALWVSPLTFLEASTPGTGGFIDTPNQRLGIQHNLPIIKPSDLGSIRIDGTTGAPLTLADVATVVEGHQPLIGDAVLAGNTNDAGFLMVIEKLPNADTRKVTQGVEKALADLRPGLSGVTMDSSIFRSADYVERSASHLRRSVIFGALVVIAVLALLTLDWGAVLVGTASIALSFVAAALVFHLFNRPINYMIFVGMVLALGAVVDDVFLHLEAAGRSIGQARSASLHDQLARGVIMDSSIEAGRTALWSTVAFVAALLPIFFLNGLSGDAFFPPVAIASILALIFSLLISTTVTPALGLLLLRRSTRRVPPVSAAGGAYANAVGVVARTPVPALIATVLLIGLAALMIPRFDKALVPNLKDRDLLVRWSAANGTSLTEMDRIMRRAGNDVRSLPQVRAVATQVGQAVLGDRPVGSDSAEMWVSIKPSAKYSTAVAAVTAAVRNYPGLRHEVLTYREDRLRNSLGRTGSEITVRVFGQDLKVLRTKANEVKALLGGLSGVRDPHVTTQAAEPTIEIEVDLQKANKFGIKPGDVRRAGATLLSGLRVGSLFEDQKIFDVVVWSTPDSRQSLSTVRDLIIDTPGGQHIRMGDVADVRVRPTAPVIEHQDISRFLDVTANVHGRSVAGVAGKVRAGLASIRFPLEYHATLLKDYDDQQNAQRRVLGFVLAAAAAVFLILQAAFSSWRAAVLAFLMIPAAAAGGVIAAWLYGGPMTVATVAGLLAIVAITLRQTIALINSFGRLRMPVFDLDGSLTRDGTPLGAELVRRGVQERFSSVVLSLVTTGAAILPAALFGNIEGQEIVQPMVVVILGGLVTVAIVELFVLPSLFCHFGPPEPAVPLELEVEYEPRRSFELVGVQRSATPMSQQVTTTGELA